MVRGLYFDIGNNARDLLYKDSNTTQMFDVTTYTANEVVRISPIFTFIFLVRVLVVFSFSAFFDFHREFLLRLCCDFLPLESKEFIFRELDCEDS
ncbi:hypothetical protein DsansV1_C26g0193791 [Dioscorea sansibarensis]